MKTKTGQEKALISDYQKDLLNKLEDLSRLAKAGKLKRLFHNPPKYLFAILWRKFLYPIIKIPFPVTTATFWGEKIKLLLPAATDIFLLGGKSHSSEIALAKFLVKNLKQGDTFIDIGAHYGYFSMLSSHLVKDNGNVFAFEPTPSTFKVMKENLSTQKNTEVNNTAASNQSGSLDFYIFSNLYSEYNTFFPEQFKSENWYKEGAARIEKIAVVRLSDFFHEKDIIPTVIKIDVEGAEARVIEGLHPYLEKNSPKIVMEYLSEKRGNQSHKRAAQMLFDKNYLPFFITETGDREQITGSIEEYLNLKGVDSDNILFKKNGLLS